MISGPPLANYCYLRQNGNPMSSPIYCPTALLPTTAASYPNYPYPLQWAPLRYSGFFHHYRLLTTGLLPGVVFRATLPNLLPLPPSP